MSVKKWVMDWPAYCVEGRQIVDQRDIVLQTIDSLEDVTRQDICDLASKAYKQGVEDVRRDAAHAQRAET